MAPDNLRAKVGFLEAHPSVGLVHSNVTRIGLRRLVQALAFRLASKPGFTWLRAFRGLGKRILSG